MTKCEVLDNGHVHLVDSMGSDLTACNAARVSFNKETEWDIDKESESRLKRTNSSFSPSDVRKLADRDVKLSRYLANHIPCAPFAHPQITLRIKAPISIRTQFFKHKQGLVENENRRRYVAEEPDL